MESTPPPTGAWRVVRVIDGDTLDVVSADGRTETVRVIGIDAPESGECGYAEAADALARQVLGEVVDLVAGTDLDRDRYRRLLRYIDQTGLDIGLELIRGGFAVARYDSRDGYGRHTREDAYVAADAASLPNCEEQPGQPVSPGAATATTDIPVTPQSFPNCDSLRHSYPGGVARIGVVGNTVAGEIRPFAAEPMFDDDLYEANAQRDGDADGIACEP